MAFKRVVETPEASPQESGILNTLGGLAARGGEALLGIPGNIAQLGKSAGEYINSFLPEAPINFKTQSPLLTGAKLATGNKNIPTSVEDIPLPTEELFRGFTKRATGESLEPKNLEEKHAQEFISTLVPILSSGAGLVKSLATAGAGQIAKFGSEFLSIPEYGKEGIKTGAMLLTSLVGLPTAEKYAKSLYASVGDKIKDAKPLPIKTTLPEIRRIHSIVEESAIPKKDIVLNSIEAIEKIAAKSKDAIPAEDIWKLKKDINEWLRRPEIFHTSTAKKALGDISSHLNKELIKTNPLLGKELTTADQIWRSLKATEDASAFTNSVLGKLQKLVAPTTAAVVASFLPGGKAVKAAAGIGYGAYQAGKGAFNFYNKIKDNPGLQKYYKSIVSSAISQNAGQLTKEIKKLDMYLKKHPDTEKQSGKFRRIS